MPKLSDSQLIELGIVTTIVEGEGRRKLIPSPALFDAWVEHASNAGDLRCCVAGCPRALKPLTSTARFRAHLIRKHGECCPDSFFETYATQPAAPVRVRPQASSVRPSSPDREQARGGAGAGAGSCSIVEASVGGSLRSVGRGDGQPRAKKPRKEGIAADGADSAGDAAATALFDPKEKRLRRYRSSPSYDTRVRIERARSQRLFLIHREPTRRIGGAVVAARFSVMGSTGNVYDTCIDNEVTCNCPDFARRQSVCKHILFVMLKVLRAPDELVYQAALLNSELCDIFKRAPKRTTAIASNAVLSAYAAITGQPVDVGTDAGSGAGADTGPVTAKQKDPAGQDCAICFDEMTSADELVWCKSSCGNNVHKACMTAWSTAQRKQGKAVTCVYCREDWAVGDLPEKKAASGSAGVSVSRAGGYSYLNMADVAGVSRQRGPYYGM